MYFTIISFFLEAVLKKADFFCLEREKYAILYAGIHTYEYRSPNLNAVISIFSTAGSYRNTSPNLAENLLKIFLISRLPGTCPVPTGALRGGRNQFPSAQCLKGS
jgi:hypothetical protein